MISYTTTDRVFLLGDARNPSTRETELMEAVVPAVSRQLDSWLNQTFAQQTYTNEVFQRAKIDTDGILQCWPACPTMSTPTAIAWKTSTDRTWNDITGTDVDIFSSQSGCQLRILGHNFLGYRRERLYLRLTFTGGWATIDDVPVDFEYGCRRACWMEYKKRDSVDQGKTAIPQLGVIVTPGSWPADLKRTFSAYRRLVQ